MKRAILIAALSSFPISGMFTQTIFWQSCLISFPWLHMTEPRIEYRPATLPSGFDIDEFIRQSLVYPERARDYAINGTVVLSMKVSCQGAISEIAVAQSLGFGCDEAAVAMLKKWPALIPATFGGEPIASTARIEIRFIRE